VTKTHSNNPFETSGSSPTGSAQSDFRCENHGSIFLLYPLSDSARDWIEENLTSDAQWFAQAVAVEHRYIWAILDGIQSDGMTVRS
jgi:hypothetical protein